MRAALLVPLLAIPIAAAPKAPAVPPPKPRVVEVSVFKDGHVLVRREVSTTPVNGEIVMDELPIPVFGSYHPYVRSMDNRLVSVTSGHLTHKTTRPVRQLDELLASNAGRPVRVVETDGTILQGRLEGELLNAVDQGGAERFAERLLAQQARTVMIRTASGTKLVPVGRVLSMTFTGPYTARVPALDYRMRLRMRLERPAAGPVTVGAVYLQKGIRWVPSYRFEVDGRGGIRAQMQATVINELADLLDTETRFVIGVPKIFNQAEVDPIALSQQPPSLSRRFRPDAISGFGGLGGFGGGFGGGGLGGAPGGRFCGDADAEELTESGEELFYLPPRRLSLKKGETQLLPLGEHALGYEDVYTVEVPFVPQEDEDRARGLTAEQRRELSAQLLEVRAKHQIRLTNAADQPLTTGPASIFRDGRLLAHSLVLYTPIGGASLCLLGDAPEVEVRHVDRETRREEVPRSENRESPYTRIEFAGEVMLRNQFGRAIDLEITRHVPGNVETAPEGDITRLDREDSPGRSTRQWVNRLTGSGRITWRLRLSPGETRKLPYAWHVYRQ